MTIDKNFESFTTGNPSFNVEDYLSEASRIYTQQFKNKDVFNRFMTLLVSGSTDIQNTLNDLLQKRSLDTAEGVQLDVIGSLVGQPRVAFDSAIIYYFGFQNVPGALGFGTLADKTQGGSFKSIKDPGHGSRTLQDSELRILIRLKIIKNNSPANIDMFVQSAKMLFGVSSVTYTESDASVNIDIGRSYNDQTKSVFKGLDEINLAKTYLPKPLGVALQFTGTIL